MPLRAAALLLAAAVSAGAARKPDPLVAARQFYNLGQYDQALDAAQQAAANPSTVSSARPFVMSRRYWFWPGRPQLANGTAKRSIRARFWGSVSWSARLSK